MDNPKRKLVEWNEKYYLMVIDNEGIILFANGQLKDLLCADLDGYNIGIYLDCENFYILKQALLKYNSSNMPSSVDLKLKNGSVHNIKWEINEMKTDPCSLSKYLFSGTEIKTAFRKIDTNPSEEKKISTTGLSILSGKKTSFTPQGDEEIKKLNERLSYFSGLTSDAIWEWNMETGEMFRNKALLNMIGFQTEKAQDLNWWFSRIHPDERHAVQKKIDRVIANKETYWYSDYTFKYADDIYRKVSDKGYVIYEKNVPVKMIGSIQNISEITYLENLLQQEKEQYEIKMAEKIVEVQEKERVYLGQELHDNVNQILASAKLYLEQLKPKKAEERIIVDKVSEFMKMAIGEIRRLSHQLVPCSLRTESLIRSIENIIDDVRLINTLSVKFSYSNTEVIESLDEERKIALFRIAQEQITNIVKHSNASNIRVNLRGENTGVIVYIYDNGLGFDTTKMVPGIGLKNIFARIKLFNGSADIASAPGNGCSLTVLMPFT